MKKLVLLLSCLIITANFAVAQISQGGEPLSFKVTEKIALEEVTFQKMPDVDVAALKAEDAELDKLQNMPWRFGKVHQVSLNPQNSGEWNYLENGTKIWRLGVSSPGAISINILFDKYKLPEGAQLFIYSADRKNIIGAFTDFNNQEDLYLATSFVFSDNVIVEYNEPANVEFEGVLSISEITHGYRGIAEYEKAFGSSGACNVNVACPESAGMEDPIRSVAMLASSDGVSNGFCTGALINNTNNDGTPYFLSANHCYSDPAGVFYIFNWQSGTCSNPGSSPSYQSLSGATQRARYADSDFWLVELNTAPPADYQPFYSGWNRTTAASINEKIWGIHHPSGDIKKISWANIGVDLSSYLGDVGTGTTHWRVGSWSDGTTTEPGSSGSPLFDNSGRIIGQLHGGYAACGNTDPDWYGSVGYSWTGGGTAATRLSDWLDPAGSGAEVIEGNDPYIVNCDAPTSQASAFSASGIGDNQMTINWTRGNGDAVIIVAREGAAVSSNPYSGNDYIANAAFGSGDAIGAGYVVYKGTGTNVTVTNLTPGTDYHYAIYEYFTADLCYLTPGHAGNAQTTGTAPCTPCYSYGNTTFNTSTTGVLFNTIDNASAKPTDASGNAYSDYTAIATDVESGLSYDLSVRANTDGNYTTHTVVWIDWNQNCSFDDAGEMYDMGTAVNVADGLTANSPLSITVPETAVAGNTVMRVSTRYNAAATSCEQNFDGEVEDYTVNVLVGGTALLGDVNDDGLINVVDIVWLVNYILGNPDPAFNIDAADVNEDTFIDVADVAAIANLILGGAKTGSFDSEVAFISVEDGNLKLESDGSLVGLQFEIHTENAENVNLELLLNDYQFSYVAKDNVIRGLVYSLNNNKIPNGIVDVLSIENMNDFEWGHIVAANFSAQSVEVLPKDATFIPGFIINETDIEIFPNPNTGNFTLAVELPVDAMLEVQLFDVTGRNVMTLQPKMFSRGSNMLEIDGGQNLENGFYILRVNGFNTDNNNLLFRNDIKVMIQK